MGNKTLNLLFFFFTICSLHGCGYFENDYIDFQQQIFENIEIQKQANSNAVNLVIANSSESYTNIIEDCASLYYNGPERIILVKEKINAYNFKFYKIKIKTDKKKITVNSLKKIEISLDYFNRYIKSESNKLKKWTF